MRVKIDENLPATISALLTARGLEADTVAGEGMAGASDDGLLDAVRQTGG